MKLHRLDLTGFGPFRERQSVDFDAFDEDGVFLIAGRTGAGKSSLLDGVSFALYGTVPRYEGGERRLRSDHCFLGDPTEVRLEFTAGERRLRVTRAPEYDRPAKRGGGLTTEPQRALLEERVADGWVGLAAKPREVALLLDEMLGLNAAQFQQVILLAQNRFSRFLLATAAERQSVLRTLFGSRRFEQYKDDLEERRKAAQRAVDTAGERVRTLLDVAEQVIVQHEVGGDEAAGVGGGDLVTRRDAVSRASQRAEYRVETRARERGLAEEALSAADRRLTAAAARAEREQQRVAARTRLDELEAEEPVLRDARERLGRARAAEALRATLEAAERTAVALEVAVRADDDAEAAWVRAGGDPTDDLDQVIDALSGDIARWSAAVAQESELAEATARLRAIEVAIADRSEGLRELDARLDLVPAERQRIQARLAEATARAERRAELHRERDDLLLRQAAAREAVELAAVAATAERTYLDVRRAADAAGAAVTRLLQRRLAGHAGELAAALADGEPCAVCGSLDHPRPAEPEADAVTDDDLAAAELERDRANATERERSEEARVAREAAAAATARAGGYAPGELDERVSAAEQAVLAVEEAAAEVVTNGRLLSELDEATAAVVLERDLLAERLRADEDQASALRGRIAAVTEQVASARGDHESVAARVAEAEERRGRARERRQAAAERAERERVAVDAARDRDERISASAFDGVAEAIAALVPLAEQDAIDTRLAAHASELGAVRARLLELELDLAAVDDAPDDLETVRAARDDAARASAAAIAAEADAAATADRLRTLIAQLDAAYDSVAAVAEEAAVVARLADSVAGRAPNTMKMDLETFVLAAELEEIVAAANLRLVEMSAGRYTLHHSDARASHGRASGLGIDVLDAHTGRLRPPQSLSGGETFLASLALALGLAEVVTQRAGGLRLDTLFVDEGFGSLDPETLELAMRTLDELRAGGRTVGVISHVEAMKEQLPAQVVVTATPDGPSVVHQTAPAELPGQTSR